MSLEDEEKRFQFLTREIAVAGISMIAAVGIGWGIMTTKVSATEDKVAKVEGKQEDVAKDVAKITTDIEVIKNEQHHIKEALDKRDADIRRIRAILERNYPSPRGE